MGAELLSYLGKFPNARKRGLGPTGNQPDSMEACRGIREQNSLMSFRPLADSCSKPLGPTLWDAGQC